jgi:hypothetical protein
LLKKLIHHPELGKKGIPAQSACFCIRTCGKTIQGNAGKHVIENAFSTFIAVENNRFLMSS